MKLISKSILLTISLVALLTTVSCSNEDKAPQIVKESMSKLYPGIKKIKWDKEDHGLWKAEFKNNGVETSLTFDAKGVFKSKEEEVPAMEIPQNIMAYFAKNTATGQIEEIERYTNAANDVFYKVEAKKSESNYYFDAQGNFIQETEEDLNEEVAAALSASIAPKIDGDIIRIDQLPQPILKYIADNHAGYQVESATYDPLCSGGDAIDVKVIQKDGSGFSLIFTTDGMFVQMEQDMSLDAAPDNIKKVVRTKFAGYVPAQQIEVLKLANSQTQYQFDLIKDGKTKEVILDVNGNIVCEN